MIQSTQELPLILATNTSDITFSNDELRTRSATCSGWLNHTEGTAQYTILGNGNLTVDGLPSQTGQSGKYLTTNGTTASWAIVDALPSQSGQNGVDCGYY